VWEQRRATAAGAGRVGVAAARSRVVGGGLLAVALSLAAAAVPAAVHAFTLRTVALEGDAAPGGGTFDSFRRPMINDLGHVAFLAAADGSEVVVSEAGGTLGEVAREGDVAPDTAGATFERFEQLTLNDADEVAFGAVLAGSADTGIWAESPGGLRKVAQTGDPAPGTGGAASYTESFANAAGGEDQVVLSDSGTVGFHAALDGGGGFGEGIFSSDPVLDEAVAVTMPAPGFTDLVNDPVVNSSGNLAFVGEFNSGLTTDKAVYLEIANTPTVVAMSSEPAPDVSDAEFSGFSIPVVNSTGHVAFRATLAGTGVVSADNESLWSTTAGLALVVREDDAAPGGGRYGAGTSFLNVVLSGQGEVAFAANLRDVPNGTDTGIYSTAGGLHVVAREGDPAPGAADGATLFFSSGFEESYALNDRGNVALALTLDGPSVDRRAILAEVDGTLQVVVEEGDALEVAPGDFRTIQALTDSSGTPGLLGDTGNEDGRPSAFNDHDEIAFVARFTDGTDGIFVLPEPGPSAGLLAGALALVGLRTRRPVGPRDGRDGPRRRGSRERRCRR